jgi:hypothetical protein
MTALFPHQRDSVINMRDKEQNCQRIIDDVIYFSRGFILGDRPGFGKTLSMLNLIETTDFTDRKYYPSRREMKIYETKTVGLNFEFMRDIYVTPPHLYLQVSGEIKQHTTLLTLGVALENDVMSVISTLLMPINANEYPVILISTNVMGLFLQEYTRRGLYIYRLIIDEADSARLPSPTVMSTIKYSYLWLMTGTYMSFRNSLKEIKSAFLTQTFGRLTDEEFNSLVVCTPDDELSASVNTEFLIEYITHVCERSAPIRQLTRYIEDNETLQDLENNNIASAMARLGGQECNSIISAIRSSIDEEMLSALESDNVARIVNLQTRLANFERDVEKLKDEPCMICLEKLDSCTVTPCCQNLACSTCLLTWIISVRNNNHRGNSPCPCCRANISTDQLRYINSQVSTINVVSSLVNPIDPAVRRSPYTKEGTISKLVKANGASKFLIYSKARQNRNIAREIGTTAATVEGTQSEKERVIANYKTGATKCIFLNPTSMAPGLNLENTTDIVVYEKVSSAVMLQILGRALRLTRPADMKLFVHILEYED